MASSNHAARLDEGDYCGALAAWRLTFSGREDSLEASWELAGIEERWGDSLFFGGETDSAVHYQAAQRALFPLGMLFSWGEESDRRMEAYTRLTDKRYAIGPDGKSRPGHAAQPHPSFTPIAPKPIAPPPEAVPEPEEPEADLPAPETGTMPPAEPEPEEPEEPEAEPWKAVLSAPKTRTRQPAELRLLDDPGDHWRCHHLGQLWLDAAGGLALHYPAEARLACQWSLHYFDLYSQAWIAHAPASRWDSDGGQEALEVQNLRDSLAAATPESPPPEWVTLLLAGSWQDALALFGGDPPAPEFEPLAVLLADACQAADRQEADQSLRAKVE